MTNKQVPSDAAARSRIGERLHTRGLWVACWLVALLLGLAQLWTVRLVLNGDNTQNLDMAGAVSRGQWSEAINGLWSPLYPTLLGLALRIFRPSRSWEIPFAHLVVNFAVYTAALGCFSFFLLGLLRAHRNAASNTSSPESESFPEWAWITLGFALFIWTTLQMIHLVFLNADLCVAALDYLAAGLLLRIHIKPAGWRAFLLLGFVLGLGYWAKAPMFLMAFAFMFAGLLAAGNLRIAFPRLAASLLIFLVVASPLVLAQSRKYGHFTFGDSATINYACFLDGVNEVNWVGQPPDSGTPKHAPQKLLDEPPVYSYASHLKGTYPPMYDLAYWDAGMKAHFTLRGQVSASLAVLLIYFQLFPLRQGAIIGAIVALLVLSGPWRSTLRNLTKYSFVWLPPLAALCMYALVHVEPRMIAGYTVLLWLGLLSGIRLPPSPEFKRIASALAISMIFVLCVQIAGREVSDFAKRMNDAQRVNWAVAGKLRQMGVVPGDLIASAGDTNNASWHHLLGVSIVAETPDTSKESFWWAGDPQVKAQVFQAFAKAGAKAVVADRMPLPGWSADWQQIGDTRYFVHFLR